MILCLRRAFLPTKGSRGGLGEKGGIEEMRKREKERKVRLRRERKEEEEEVGGVEGRPRRQPGRSQDEEGAENPSTSREAEA